MKHSFLYIIIRWCSIKYSFMCNQVLLFLAIEYFELSYFQPRKCITMKYFVNEREKLVHICAPLGTLSCLLHYMRGRRSSSYFLRSLVRTPFLSGLRKKVVRVWKLADCITLPPAWQVLHANQLSHRNSNNDIDICVMQVFWKSSSS